MANLTVYKDNEVTEASYKLTLIEQRVVLYCISKINPLDSNKFEEQKIQTIIIEDFIRQFPDIKPNNAYKQIKDAVNKLYERSIIVKNPRSVKTFRWISSKHYFKNEAKAIIRFSDDVMPYLADLNQQFTKYKLRNISAFKRTYSIRLYELLTQYKTLKSRIISAIDLRVALQLNNKFKPWSEFKRNVIDSSIKEINEKSDLFVSYELIKKGRSIDSIQFSIKEKNEINKINEIIKSKKELNIKINKYVNEIKNKLRA